MNSSFRLSIAAQHDVEHGRRALPVVLIVAHGAWSLTYWLTREARRIASASAALNSARSISSPTVSKPPSTSRSTSRSASVQLAGLGHGAEVAVGARQRAVNEVAPVGHELVVVSPHELRPGEVAVLRLGPGRRQEVPERVGVVALEEVADVDRRRRGWC